MVLLPLRWLLPTYSPILKAPGGTHPSLPVAVVGWTFAALFKSLARNTVSPCLMTLLLESNNIVFFTTITENFHGTYTTPPVNYLQAMPLCPSFLATFILSMGFGKSAMSHDHRHSIIQKNVAALKTPCALRVIPPSFPLQPRPSLIFSLWSLYVALPFPEGPIIGLIQQAAFSDWLLSLSYMHLRGSIFRRQQRTKPLDVSGKLARESLR